MRRLLVLLLILSLLPFGCAPKPKEAKITLQMWVMPNSLEPLRDVEKVLAPFKEKHPEIDIKVTVLDWGAAWPKITTAATSGDTPDIVQLGTTWVGAISAMGALMDLKDKVKELGGSKAFVDASWATSGLTGSGQVTAIPWIVDARCLFYRTDVFKKLGLTKNDIKDWNAFKKTLHKIKAANLEIEGVKVAPLGIPGKNDWNVIHNLAPWIWMAGGDFVSKDYKRSILNEPAAFEGVSFFVSFVREGLVPISDLELNTAQISSNFNNGNYACYFDGPYEVKVLTLPPAQGGAANSIAGRTFAVAPYPAGPKGRITFVGGSNLAIFKYSKHKKEAFEVVKHLTSYDAQVTYAKLSGFLPALKAAFEDPFFSADPHRRVFKEAVKYGKSYPCISTWGLAEPVLTRRFGIMWDWVLEVAGPYSPEKLKESLDLAAKELTSILAGY